MKLSTKLVIAATVPIFVLFAISLASSSLIIETVIEKANERSLVILCEQMRDKLDLNMYERLLNIKLAANLISSTNASDFESVDSMFSFLQSSLKDTSWLGFVDLDGTVLASTGGVLQGRNVSQRNWFIEARKGSTFAGDVHPALLLAPFLQSPNATEPLRFVDLAVPVHNHHTGEMLGVLGFHLGLQWTTKVTSTMLDPSANIDYFIISSNDYVWMGPSKYYNPQDPVKITGEALDCVQQARSGKKSCKAVWPDGGTYMTGMSKDQGVADYPGLGWVILARQSMDLTVQAQGTMIGISVACSVAILFVALGVARYFYVKVYEPIVKLSLLATKLLSSHANITTTDVTPSATQPPPTDITTVENSPNSETQSPSAPLIKIPSGRQLTSGPSTASTPSSRSQMEIESDALEGGHTPIGSMRPSVVDAKNVWTTVARQESARSDEVGVLYRSLNSLLSVLDRTAYVRFQDDLLDEKVEERTAHLQQVIRDLEDAKAMAEAAYNAKSQFLSTMSHELRTPMNAVIANTVLLLDSDLNQDQREMVQTIQSGGEHLVAIVNDILDYQRMEAGRLPLEPVTCSLRKVVEDCVEMLGMPASTKGLELGYCLCPDVPDWIFCDALRLRQVLCNLLSNAVKFTSSGHVWVEVTLLHRFFLSRRTLSGSSSVDSFENKLNDTPTATTGDLDQIQLEEHEFSTLGRHAMSTPTSPSNQNHNQSQNQLHKRVVGFQLPEEDNSPDLESGGVDQVETVVLQFKVMDTGIGIPEDALKNKLFKHFSQVEGTLKKHYGGSGLGLVISKTLTQMMGGDIEATSTIGQGTTFTFTITCSLSSPGPPPPTPMCPVRRASDRFPVSCFGLSELAQTFVDSILVNYSASLAPSSHFPGLPSSNQSSPVTTFPLLSSTSTSKKSLIIVDVDHVCFDSSRLSRCVDLATAFFVLIGNPALPEPLDHWTAGISSLATPQSYCVVKKPLKMAPVSQAVELFFVFENEQNRQQPQYQQAPMSAQLNALVNHIVAPMSPGGAEDGTVGAGMIRGSPSFEILENFKFGGSGGPDSPIRGSFGSENTAELLYSTPSGSQSALSRAQSLSHPEFVHSLLGLHNAEVMSSLSGDAIRMSISGSRSGSGSGSGSDAFSIRQHLHRIRPPKETPGPGSASNSGGGSSVSFIPNDANGNSGNSGGSTRSSEGECSKLSHTEHDRSAPSVIVPPPFPPTDSLAVRRPSNVVMAGPLPIPILSEDKQRILQDILATRRFSAPFGLDPNPSKPNLYFPRRVARFPPPAVPIDMSPPMSPAGSRTLQSDAHLPPPLSLHACLTTALNEKSSPKILLVDDNAINLKVLRALLKKCGHTNVFAVEDGQQALFFIKEQGPELVLTDLNMPNMDGLELSREIFRLNMHRPKVYAVTGDALQETRDACIAAGMSGVLLKPISISELGEILKIF